MCKNNNFMLPSKRITFRSTTVLFLLGLIAFFWLHQTVGLSYWVLVAWVHVYVLVQVCGAYFIGMNFHIESTNALPGNSRRVLLTFDDGPHSPTTARVLDVLKQHGVKAVFFVIGKQVKGREELLGRIVDEGHWLGNHSFSHDAWIDLWPAKKIAADLQACQQAVEAFQPGQHIMRPPYGVTNPNMAKAIRSLGLRSIGWNIRSYDTSIKDPAKIEERILRRLKPGAIILLHDRLDYMPDLLNRLIPAIRAQGYELLSDLSVLRT